MNHIFIIEKFSTKTPHNIQFYDFIISHHWSGDNDVFIENNLMDSELLLRF